MIRTLSLISSLAIFGTATAASTMGDAFLADAASKYDHTSTMGPNQEVSIFWTVDTQSKIIKLAVSATDATGWIGFGLSDAGGMAGADIVVFEAKTKELTDYHSLAFVRPTKDVCQSWTKVLAFETTRPLDTKDPQDRALVDDSNLVKPATNIIAAWGDQDTLSFHGPDKAGRASVRFFQTKDGVQKSTRDRLIEAADGSFLVSTGNYTIPTVETTYHDVCADVRAAPGWPQDIPDDQIIHLIGADFVPSRQQNGVDTSKYIHHLSVAGNYIDCASFTELGVEGEAFFYGWAAGHEPNVLPDDVGIALGGTRGFQSVFATYHFDNRDGDEGVVDDSAIEVFYTLTPRSQEAQVLITGDPWLGLFGQSVGTGPTRHDFTCPSSCSVNNWAGPVTVFAEAMHAHESATRGVTRVMRNGEDLIHEAGIEVWDFDRNGIKQFQIEPYQVQPGDTFHSMCYYDNPDDSTTWGLGSQQEMCQSLFWFYPAVSNGTGYCGPSLSAITPEKSCDSGHVMSSVADDFGRTFGSSLEECPAEALVETGGSDESPPEDNDSAGFKIQAGAAAIVMLSLSFL